MGVVTMDVVVAAVVEDVVVAVVAVSFYRHIGSCGRILRTGTERNDQKGGAQPAGKTAHHSIVARRQPDGQGPATSCQRVWWLVRMMQVCWAVPRR